jgi:FMN phosphatase YigB (HAD superfamily)
MRRMSRRGGKLRSSTAEPDRTVPRIALREGRATSISAWIPLALHRRNVARCSGPSMDYIDDVLRLVASRRAKIDVLSVDVYDTVLTRNCGDPSDLYLLLGRSLARRGEIEWTPEVFARVRHQAELSVWQREGDLDSPTSLADFYLEVADFLSIPIERVPGMVQAELDLERRLLRAVPRAAEGLSLARAAGVQVAFVSDTYLSQDTVREHLELHGLLANGDHLFVSSAWSRSKASGALFETALDRFAPSSRVLHVGDHPHSDLAMPRRLRLEAKQVTAGRLNRYERLLSERSFDTAGLATAFAGASRLARLAVGARGGHERALSCVAAGVAAPVLVGYVLWLLERARAHSLDRLVFLARDGQVMHLIAEGLIARMGLPLRTSYLYVSRQSTNLAATYELSEDETDWAFRDAELVSDAELLARFGLRLDDLGETAESDPAPGGVGRAKRVAALLGLPDVQRRVLASASAQRDMLTDFLRQEGLLAGERVGLVDFGGVGSQVRALHVLLSNEQQPPPKIFLVGLDSPEAAGLNRPAVDPAWLSDVETYLYDHRRSRGLRRPRGFGSFVQMFCAADHGTVLGYERRGEAIVPLLEMSRDRRLTEWGLTTVRETIDEFVRHLEIDQELVDLRGDTRRVACDLVQLVWGGPEREEAAAWGSFPFEGAQATDSKPRPLAFAYSWRYVLSESRSGRFPDLGWQHWFEGSVALSPLVLRVALRRASRAYTVLSRSQSPLFRFLEGVVRRLAGR